MKSGGKIRLCRHLHVTQNYIPKYKKYTPSANGNYENLIGPFFSTYMEEYVERQNGKYDELLTTVRKLLKVKISGKTTKKHITFNESGKFCLTCIDIRKDKATWRKDDYKMVLRYFEFSIKNFNQYTSTETAQDIVTVLNANYEDATGVQLNVTPMPTTPPTPPPFDLEQGNGYVDVTP